MPHRAHLFSLRPCHAFIEACIDERYTPARFVADLLAGITVGIIAIPLAMALAIAVTVGFVFLVLGPSRMTTFDSTEASANMRFWYWSFGVELLFQHPIFGAGYGQFLELNHGMLAHNSFVQCFAELGLVGYFFWIEIMFAHNITSLIKPR